MLLFCAACDILFSMAHWNKEVWYTQLMAIGMGVVIFSFGIYIGAKIFENSSILIHLDAGVWTVE